MRLSLKPLMCKVYQHKWFWLYWALPFYRSWNSKVTIIKNKSHRFAFLFSDEFHDLLLNGARRHNFFLIRATHNKSGRRSSRVLLTSRNRWSLIIPFDSWWWGWLWNRFSGIRFGSFKRFFDIFFDKDSSSSSAGAGRCRYGAREVEGGSGGRGGCRISKIPKPLRQEWNYLSKKDPPFRTVVENHIFIIILNGQFRRGYLGFAQILLLAMINLNREGCDEILFNWKWRLQFEIHHYFIFDEKRVRFWLITTQNTDEG